MTSACDLDITRIKLSKKSVQISINLLGII